ncbi:MAG: UbiD family decarboxylase [Gammaproteobacteria bacterium]|nr:UbiD family decarboxylase [Gammaproteobacteria bacterium]
MSSWNYNDMADLRQFLAEHASAVWELPGAVSPRHELTALQHALDARGEHPVIVARSVSTVAGAPSPIPVVTNLTASRALTARALGFDDHREVARGFAARSRAPIPPVVVPPHGAPVRQVVLEGEAASLHDLPVLTQHEGEPGPYLTAAHATTFDPDSGIDNTAIQRCWVKGPREMTWFPYPASHNARNLAKFHARGEPCPVAFWIGHHPAVLLGTQAKLRYPESHWAAAGGVLGAPLRLVPSVLHGERVMVPADAEIVIEGWAHPVLAVGEEVDIFSPQSLRWALATRVQWSRDAIVVDGLSGSALDPSLDPPGPTTSKVGIDATRRSPGTQVSTVPQAALRRAAELLAGAGGEGWPRS